MINKLKNIKNKLNICFSILYSTFLVYIFTTSLWRFLKPGYLSNRAAEIYHYPELLFLFVLFCSIFTYPLIVIISFNRILNKVEIIENKIKNINKDAKWDT